VLSGENSQAGASMNLISALWRVTLTLELKRPLLNRDQILINVLMALASIIHMCSLHVILLPKITLRYFT
jgi:hypothetical protein